MLLSQFSLNLRQTQKREGLFRRIVYDCYFADWDGLPVNLEHVPWEDLFKISASASAGEI